MAQVKAVFTADISQFRQSLAQATTAVTAFDKTTGQVNSSLKRFGNEFSGAKIRTEAETIARAISDIGGASKLTESEIKRANATITEALSKYKALGTEAPASVRNLANELKHLNTESAKVGTTLSGIGGSLKSGLGALAGGLGIGVGAGLGLGAITALGSTIADLAGDATRLTPLQQSFERLQGGAMQA
jgi:hypothetical protein